MAGVILEPEFGELFFTVGAEPLGHSAGTDPPMYARHKALVGVQDDLGASG